MSRGTRALAAVGPDGLPILECASGVEWQQWLNAHHASAPGVWVRLGKKGSGLQTVTRADALGTALCYGWIDGQGRSESEQSWLQRFTPRRPRSRWSQVNCAAAERLIVEGRMQPAGLREVEATKRDGRWDAAYAPPSSMPVPDDLQARLDASARARDFFERLDSRNRYAILYRLHDAKRVDTRQRRLDQFVAMLEAGETLY